MNTTSKAQVRIYQKIQAYKKEFLDDMEELTTSLLNLDEDIFYDMSKYGKLQDILINDLADLSVDIDLIEEQEKQRIKMNEIKKERIEVLEETLNRMKNDYYQEIHFADKDKLIYLLKQETELNKQKKCGRILSMIDDDDERKQAEYEYELIKKDNQEIDELIKPIYRKIQILELELMLYNGTFEMINVLEDIKKGVDDV